MARSIFAFHPKIAKPKMKRLTIKGIGPSPVKAPRIGALRPPKIKV